MLPCVSLLCVLVFGPPGIALGGQGPVSRAPATSIQAFGRANPRCAAWSNSCVTCESEGGGAAHCSTPGIACTPGPIVCSLDRTP